MNQCRIRALTQAWIACRVRCGTGARRGELAVSTVAAFHPTGIGVPCLVRDNGQRPSVMVRYFRVKELESLRYSFVMFLHLWNVAVRLKGRGRSMVVGMSERCQ